MYNPFNRIVFPGIGVGNPITPATHNSNGQLTGGFGFMNVNNVDCRHSQEFVGGGKNLILISYGSVPGGAAKLAAAGQSRNLDLGEELACIPHPE